jgi:hypothetical protein
MSKYDSPALFDPALFWGVISAILSCFHKGRKGKKELEYWTARPYLTHSWRDLFSFFLCSFYELKPTLDRLDPHSITFAQRDHLERIAGEERRAARGGSPRKCRDDVQRCSPGDPQGGPILTDYSVARRSRYDSIAHSSLLVFGQNRLRHAVQM